jgi:hypothetical protein
MRVYGWCGGEVVWVVGSEGNLYLLAHVKKVVKVAKRSRSARFRPTFRMEDN